MVLDQQRIDRVPALARQGVEHRGGGFVRERLNDVRRDVVILEGERFDDLVGRETGQQVASEVGFDVVEGFGGRRGVGLEQDPGAFVVVESLERVGELGSVQRASEVGRAADVGRGEHGLEGEVGTFVRGRGARRRLVAGHGSSSRASLA